MIIGIPIWVGRKLYARFKTTSKHKRNIIITSGVAASVSSFQSVLNVGGESWGCLLVSPKFFFEGGGGDEPLQFRRLFSRVYSAVLCGKSFQTV